MEEQKNAEKFEKKNKPGVIIRIVKLSLKKKVAQEIYIEVRNEANALEGQRASKVKEESRRTKKVSS